MERARWSASLTYLHLYLPAKTINTEYNRQSRAETADNQGDCQTDEKIRGRKSRLAGTGSIFARNKIGDSRVRIKQWVPGSCLLSLEAGHSSIIYGVGLVGHGKNGGRDSSPGHDRDIDSSCSRSSSSSAKMQVARRLYIVPAVDVTIL
jgi:hypothetical protein